MSNGDSFIQSISLIARGAFLLIVLHLIWTSNKEQFNKPFGLKKYLFRLRSYFSKLYRVSLNYNGYKRLVWNDLKKLHVISSWSHGIYEKEMFIQTIFEIAPGTVREFYYLIDSGQFLCRTKIIETFPVEKTSELFILATHFNNVLNDGHVVINVEGNCVEYFTKSELIIHVVYPGELYGQIGRHYNTSKDIFWGFNQLVNEHEDPAIIIADVLRRHHSKGSD